MTVRIPTTTRLRPRPNGHLSLCDGNGDERFARNANRQQVRQSPTRQYRDLRCQALRD
ncbi:hypothetical protein TIFTF001_014430 [Ficus carica]|uniref:Uncharacterized protein n=1 Tax=Ficus carica TaxID=3494 RepID=A0AA88D442_FICCA|nr:hypothetical protein TIFTF001_014430 [Ficus carica]